MTDPETTEPLLAVRALRTTLACGAGASCMMAVHFLSRLDYPSCGIALVSGLVLLASSMWMSRFIPETLHAVDPSAKTPAQAATMTPVPATLPIRS